MARSDPLAIVVSAPAIGQATFDQANLAERLANAKVTHQLEVVSLARAKEAVAKLNPTMRVFFHQGGAPSRWSQEFPRAGCLVAAGYYAEIRPVGPERPPAAVPLALWNIETDIFPQREFRHVIRYENVRRISERILTKETIGRWPLPGRNFIVVGSQDEGFTHLDRLWNRLMI